MIHFIVKHRAPVLLLALCTFIMGLVSYVTLPRENNPDVKIPIVMVNTPYVGVSPEDVEGLVTIPIENEVAGVKDLKTLTSSSAEGISTVTLEFEPDVDITDALQRVREKVSTARTKIPDDVEDSVVQEISFSEMPIMLINLAGDRVDETVLKALAKDLQKDIERLPECLRVSLSGGRTRQFRVQANPDRLAHYDIGIQDLIDAIGNENVNIPGGEVVGRRSNFLVRVPGEFEDPNEIEQVAITRRGDRPVFVRDVATVIDDFEDRTTYSRLNGEPSVSLGVVKRAGANIVDLAQSAKAVVSEHQKEWPAGVEVGILADQSRDVDVMVIELQNNIILALILVVGVVLFFMGVRNSLFVAIAIPLSMLMGMMVFSLLGITLNMVVLFSLVLVLGMLVDNAIVLVENIYRHVEMGMTPFEASVAGAKEVAMPVAASTLTTVAAFAPLLGWTGIMGEFMVYLPITLVTVLISSLVVALVMLPVFTSIGMRPSKKPQAQVTDEPLKLNFVMRAYKKTLEVAMSHKWLTTVGMFGVLFGTVALYAQLNHGTEFFPDTEPDRAIVTVRAADGTDLEETDRIVREIEEVLLAEKEVKSYVAETGVSAGDFSSSSATNEAKITINFYPHPSKARPEEVLREGDTRQVVERLREQVSTIVGAEIKIENEAQGPPVGKPIEIEISSKDYHQAGEFAAQVRREIADLPGVTGLEDNYRVGRPELRFRVDRGAAKRIGSSTGEVASAVRAALSGTKASAFRDGEDEYDIIVELAPEFKDDLQSVLGLRIFGREDMEMGTFSVPISAVATYELAGGSGAINHKSQEPVVTITGDVKTGFNENEVQANVMAAIQKMEDRPASVSARLGGSNDEQAESQAFLGKAFLIAVFLIAIVLVTQFNGFMIPQIVLNSVVLSLVGVLWGLVITGTPFGIIMTGLGVISLAGVVVNNAIVLLDYVEQLRAQGRERFEALMEAGMTRFRPVMLTAITTILGLVPMAIGLSIDFTVFPFAVFWGTQSSEWWGPMAVAVIFGLAFSTLLTLVVVPTLYLVLDDMRGFTARLFSGEVFSSLRRPASAARAQDVQTESPAQ